MPATVSLARSKILYHLLAFVVVAFWGVTFVSSKVLLLNGLTPSQIFAIRFAVAYVGILAMCLGSAPARKIFADSFKDEMIFVVLGVSGGSVYFLAENSALIYTQACNVSFIVSTSPLITALMTIAFKRCFKGELSDGLEEIGGRKTLAIGSALALAGIAAVVFDGNSLKLSAGGDLLALATAICWGVYSVLMSQMSSKYGTLFATRKVFFWGIVTIIPFLIGHPFDWAVLTRPEVWGNLAFLAFIASLACFIIWNKVMYKLGNVTSTNYVYLNPLFTYLAATVVLGESLTLQSALGCAAILAGVIVGGLQPSTSKK